MVLSTISALAGVLAMGVVLITYSALPLQKDQPIYPLAGNLVTEITVDGITRLCQDGDETCKSTGNSNPIPEDPNQIVYLHDMPGVEGGKELRRFRTGCGMGYELNSAGEVVLSSLIEVGPGLTLDLGCEDGDPHILGLNASFSNQTFDVQDFSDNHLTDLCGISHQYFAGNDTIGFEAVIEGDAAITVACVGGVQQLGVNGTALVDALDVERLQEVAFSNGCGVDTVFVSGTIRERLSVTNSDGYITFGACVDGDPVSFDLALLDTGIGGTGFDTASTGVVLVGSAGNWIQLPAGTEGQVFTISSGIPAWTTPSSGGVTSVGATSPLSSTGGTTPTISIGSTIGTTLGGTGFNSATSGDLLYGNAGSWAKRAIGTNNQLLVVSSGLPTWQSFSTLVTADYPLDIFDDGTSISIFINGVVPAIQGGTGYSSSSIFAGDLLYGSAGSGWFTLPLGNEDDILMVSNSDSVEWIPSLTTSQGGTGYTTIPSGAIIQGEYLGSGNWDILQPDPSGNDFDAALMVGGSLGFPNLGFSFPGFRNTYYSIGAVDTDGSDTNEPRYPWSGTNIYVYCPATPTDCGDANLAVLAVQHFTVISDFNLILTVDGSSTPVFREGWTFTMQTVRSGGSFTVTCPGATTCLCSEAAPDFSTFSPTTTTPLNIGGCVSSITRSTQWDSVRLNYMATTGSSSYWNYAYLN